MSKYRNATAIPMMAFLISGWMLGASPTCKDGWSSQTQTCGAESAIQKAIVARAKAAIGGYSGQSLECTLSSGCWLTDADPNSGSPDFYASNPANDGNKLKQGLHQYYLWLLARTKPYSLAYLQSTVIANLLTNYATTDRQTMAAHIVNNACPATDPINWNANQVMSFLVIQKQCMEWAITTALSVPGTVAKNYGSTPFPVSNRVRPGMGLYIKNVHAMLIIDVQWKNNLPVAFQVAEANHDTRQYY